MNDTNREILDAVNRHALESLLRQFRAGLINNLDLAQMIQLYAEREQAPLERA